MAIRLRQIKSTTTKCGWMWIALCAAEYEAQDGDVYLDDAQHEALHNKFDRDMTEMGLNGKA